MDSFNNRTVDVVFSKHLSVVDPKSFFQDQRNQHWTEAATGCGTDIAFVSNAGVVTSAHQAVVLPLSPLLTRLLASSQCCGCPQDLATVVLPHWDDHAVRALLQLVYTGSVIVDPRQNVDLLELIKHLGFNIDKDRLEEEWMYQRPEEDEEWVDQTPRDENNQQGDEQARYIVPSTNSGADQCGQYQQGDEQVRYLVPSTNSGADEQARYPVPGTDSSADQCGDESGQYQQGDESGQYQHGDEPGQYQHGDERARYPVPGQVIGAIVDSQVNQLDGDTSEQAERKSDSFRETTADVENSSNDKQLNNSQTFTCVNCNKTFAEEKVMTYVLHERNCKERSQSQPPLSQDYQISVPNFYGHSLRDRETVYHFVDNEENNLNVDDVSTTDLDGIVKKEANESEEEESTWKNVDVCVICNHNLESLDLADRGAHFYSHFKRQLVSWLDGMLQVYFCHPKTCPQCDAKFGSKKALCKHVGSVHNLYQTFLRRYIDDFPNRKKITIKQKGSLKNVDPKCARKPMPDVNGNISKQFNKKGGKLKQQKQFTDKYINQGLQNNDDERNQKNGGGAKVVGNEDIKGRKGDNKLKTQTRQASKEATTPDMKTLVKDIACQLCNKTYATGGLLLQHTCGHFKKELKQDYPDIFAAKSGEKVACPKCNKGPMKKTVLLIHIGATHKEVTKYAPWAKTDFKKPKLQTSETARENDRSYENGNDDKVEKNSVFKKGQVKEQRIRKIRKRNLMKVNLSEQSAFQYHHEDGSPSKRKKRSAKPMFPKLSPNAQNLMDQNHATVKSADNLKLPESTIEELPLDVEQEQDKTSILVAWKDSEVDTQVMLSTGLLDPADLSQLVKSAKLALNKQGE